MRKPYQRSSEIWSFRMDELDYNIVKLIAYYGYKDVPLKKIIEDLFIYNSKKEYDAIYSFLCYRINRLIKQKILEKRKNHKETFLSLNIHNVLVEDGSIAVDFDKVYIVIIEKNGDYTISENLSETK